ncbi:MAG: hypothetical protein ABSA67_11275 [Candidatus Brocadiia bacterium]|jgi:hypothetical protein
MPREAGLYEAAAGSVVEGYLRIKASGGNIPPAWIDRARYSRKRLQKDVARVLKKGKPADIIILRDWETRYRKECFYHGLRALLELDRTGKTRQ